MKKHMILLLALSSTFCACQHEEVEIQTKAETIYARTGELDKTKTHLDENYDILWDSGDEIVAFTGGRSIRKKFLVNSEAVDKTDGTFTKDSNYEYAGKYETIGNSIALYPFSEITCSVSEGHYMLGNVILPSEQTYSEGSFGKGAMPMTAVTEDAEAADFRFRNVCGALMLQFKGSGAIESISVEGNDGEPLCGKASIKVGYGADPEITMADDALKKVTLTCNGEELDENVIKTFFIVLPPTDFKQGFKVTITDNYGTLKQFKASANNIIARSRITRMPVLTYHASITYTDLSINGSANSYIISEPGYYKIPTTKGNSNTSVGESTSAEVLWETFGTSTAPNTGDLVTDLNYENGYLTFKVPAEDKKGNASIAVKDASGTILWSWHLWFTDTPAEQQYANNAGIMMDRNLGATSATPGEVGALGLLYQWGRKDPFIGSSSISEEIKAASTLKWPSSSWSSSTTGTVEYVTAHPTTFIRKGTGGASWQYGTINTDLWGSEKTIYDPCPPGWRVPEGGPGGVWRKAGFEDTTYDKVNKGISFNTATSEKAWYPGAGYYNETAIDDMGYGHYWSATTTSDSNNPFYLDFDPDGSIDIGRYFGYSNRGKSIRCMKEGSGIATPPEITDPIDLSASGTSNCYIISEKGSYKFPVVKGNSNESVGDVSSATILWESLGTDEITNIGELIYVAEYKNGYIEFATSTFFKKGNAVIAAKDASGTILWSWHIWMTDKPEEHYYTDDGDILMDRNLGATSTTPGDDRALGLFYQWGRKDPFIGSADGTSVNFAASTGNWKTVTSSNSIGTIDYAVKNPTTYINDSNSSEFDWLYSARDNELWKTDKTIYDPCPPGWKIPDIEVWATGNNFQIIKYNTTYDGLSITLNDLSDVWYPTAGYYTGSLSSVSKRGYYWSSKSNVSKAYSFFFVIDDTVGNSKIERNNSSGRANGFSVRCCKE